MWRMHKKRDDSAYIHILHLQRFFPWWWHVYTATPPIFLGALEIRTLDEILKQVSNCLIKVYRLCECIASAVREKVRNFERISTEGYVKALCRTRGDSPREVSKNCSRGRSGGFSESECIKLRISLRFYPRDAGFIRFCSRSTLKTRCGTWETKRPGISPRARSSSFSWTRTRPYSKPSRSICECTPTHR